MSLFNSLFASKTSSASELKEQVKELREIAESLEQVNLNLSFLAEPKVHETLHYFHYEEFFCECGREHEEQLVDPLLVKKLDTAREMAGVAFVIHSGYRCETHNREIGGVEDSAHLRGLAADIKAETSRHRFLIIDALLRVGFTRIGIATDFIHADIDDSKDDDVIWTYTKSASELL